mmetsp:Transcript_60310/g.166937  ORF Transcript_60310/g.166937 Transcript_60310/m.166937 type:complete len:408 (+) Transcript_60310:805-2028(+)
MHAEYPMIRLPKRRWLTRRKRFEVLARTRIWVALPSLIRELEKEVARNRCGHRPLYKIAKAILEGVARRAILVRRAVTSTAHVLGTTYPVLRDEEGLERQARIDRNVAVVLLVVRIEAPRIDVSAILALVLLGNRCPDKGRRDDLPDVLGLCVRAILMQGLADPLEKSLCSSVEDGGLPIDGLGKHNGTSEGRVSSERATNEVVERHVRVSVLVRAAIKKNKDPVLQAVIQETDDILPRHARGQVALALFGRRRIARSIGIAHIDGYIVDPKSIGAQSRHALDEGFIEGLHVHANILLCQRTAIRCRRVRKPSKSELARLPTIDTEEHPRERIVGSIGHCEGCRDRSLVLLSDCWTGLHEDLPGAIPWIDALIGCGILQQWCCKNNRCNQQQREDTWTCCGHCHVGF